MRSDNLKRHMKVHETCGGSMHKYDQIEEDDEALKKYMIESTNKYKEKIALGKRIYMTLEGYGLSEKGLPEEMKDALHCFMKHAHELNNCSHCDYKNANGKQMKNEDARKGDMTEGEVRNMINDSFEGFPEYMMMKLHATEVKDEERIEESINVLKYHMLNKIKK